MPAFFARRLLPLMCGDSHMVSRSVLSWPNRAVYARSRTGRVRKMAGRRGTSVGDDWQCTRMCTVTGRTLIDEWKTLDRNQR
jgi:hypothetical protein